MSKKMKYIFLFSIVFFMCNLDKISAKEIVKACQYKTPSSVTSEQQTSVLCNIYDDESHTCYIEVGGAEATTESKRLNILNWKRKLTGGISAYNPSGDMCPEYLVTIIDKGSYNLWAFDNSADAENWQVNRQKYYTTIILSPANSDLDKGEQLLVDIEHSIEDIKKGYDFNLCAYTTLDPGSNLKNICLPEVNDRIKKIDDYQERLQATVKDENISDSDENVIKVKQKLWEVKEFFTQERENLKLMVESMENGASFKEALEKHKIPGQNPTPDNEKNNTSSEVGNCALFGEHVTPIIKWIIDLVYIAVPVMIIILTIIDFVSVVLSGEDKNFKTAGSKLVKRLLIGVVILFLPMLLTFIIDLSGALVPYGIEKDQLFCSLF